MIFHVMPQWAQVGLNTEGMSFKQIRNGGPYIMQIFQTQMGVTSDKRPGTYMGRNTIAFVV